MPKAMEAALKRRAAKMGFSKERTGRFVYGTMRKHGWRPGQGQQEQKSESPEAQKFGQYSRRIKKRGQPTPRGTQS